MGKYGHRLSTTKMIERNKAMRALFESGEYGIPALADMFHVARCTAWKICTNPRYLHIERLAGNEEMEDRMEKLIRLVREKTDKQELPGNGQVELIPSEMANGSTSGVRSETGGTDDAAHEESNRKD
jgi:hypothetical protein